jgi:hypothetical protein
MAIVTVFVSLPFLALGALLGYMLIKAMLFPSAAVPEAASSVGNNTACIYSDAENAVWSSIKRRTRAR